MIDVFTGMAVGALAIEIWRQSNGRLEQDQARYFAEMYFETHKRPESAEANTDSARELWWLSCYAPTGTPVNEDPDARRLEWWRDWHTNPKKKHNLFRAMRKHFVTVFPDSDRREDWKYVISAPDGRSTFSDVYYPTTEKACRAAHRALIATVYPELLKELPA